MRGTVRALAAVVPLFASACAPGVAAPPPVLTAASGLPSDEVRAVLVDREGAAWLGFRGGGVARVHGPDLRRFDDGDGLVSNGVADLHEDEEGRIWAAGAGGFSVWDGGAWTGHSRVHGLEPRVVFSVHEPRKAAGIWLGTSAGAIRLDEKRGEVVTADDGLPHSVVHAVAVDGEGTTWFATRDGLARRTADRLETLYRGTNFRTATVAPDGGLWLGTSDGVWQIHEGTLTKHMEGRTLLVPLVARDGSVWAVSEGEGAYRLVAGRWEHVSTADGLPSDVVYDVAEAPDGALWFATARGAVRLELDR